MSERIPRPASLDPDTLAGATVAVRERVGSAWDTVAAWETGVRDLWARLGAFSWKGVGLRRRAVRLACSAPRMVEGPSSALFRAARAQKLRWDLSADPLCAVGRELVAFSAAARALLELAEEQERAVRRLTELKQRWAGFPRGWRRWTVLLELDPSEVYAGESSADLREVHARIGRLEEELARWRAEIEAWLAENGDTSFGVTEERYLAFRSIGAADRESALNRSAELVRRATRAQLDALPDTGAPPRSALVRELAHQWSDLTPAEPLSAEEAACYRVALGNAYVRAVQSGSEHPRRMEPAAPLSRSAPVRERTLYATPLDRRRVGREMIVVRRSPQTPLRVTAGGVGPAEVALEVALPDSEPALSPAELEDVRAFFDVSESPLPPYWWATQSPARFRLQQVRGGVDEYGQPSADAVFVGTLEAKGRLVQLTEPADTRPRPAGNPPLFRAYAPPGRGDMAQHLDRDPRIRPLAAVFQASDVDCWVAEVPEYGPGRLWLRTAAEKATSPIAAADFDAEAELLVRLDDVLPGSAVRVAHRGTVDLARRGAQTPYLATTVPVGHAVELWLRAAGAESVEVWGIDLAADQLRTLAAAHAEDLCVGIIGPPLVRVRPAFHVGPPVLRSILVAAPLSGRAGAPITAASLRRVPSWGKRVPVPRERTPRNDLVSLGHFLAHTVVPLLSKDNQLRRLAAQLASGAYRSADDALARLDAAAPARMGQLRSVFAPARTVNGAACVVHPASPRA